MNSNFCSSVKLFRSETPECYTHLFFNLVNIFSYILTYTVLWKKAFIVSHINGAIFYQSYYVLWIFSDLILPNELLEAGSGSELSKTWLLMRKMLNLTKSPRRTCMGPYGNWKHPVVSFVRQTIAIDILIWTKNIFEEYSSMRLQEANKL